MQSVLVRDSLCYLWLEKVSVKLAVRRLVVRKSIILSVIVTAWTVSAVTLQASENNSRAPTISQFLIPLNSDSELSNTVQLQEAGASASDFAQGTSTQAGSENTSEELLNWDHADFLLLNSPGRTVSNNRTSYDPEDEFWLFNGGFLAAVNTRSGRVCTRTGAYRICHGR